MKAEYIKPMLTVCQMQAQTLLAVSKLTVYVGDDDDDYIADENFEALVNSYGHNNVWNQD